MRLRDKKEKEKPRRRSEQYAPFVGA